MQVNLLDFSAIFRKYWHASEQEEVNTARRKTLNYVRGNVSSADHMIVCIDMPPYRRSELRPEYKAHREKAPEIMKEEMRACVEAIKKEGIRIAGSQGYEADDVIGKITAMATKEGHTVMIHSGDKDLMQLIQKDPEVSVQSTSTGEIYGPDAVEKKFGVTPEQVVDVLALMGDASDGIEGIRGVGVKTAAKWVNKYGDALKVVENYKELPESFHEKMFGVKKLIEENIELIKLADCPIDEDVMTKPEVKTEQEPEVIQEAPKPKKETAMAQVSYEAPAVSWDKELEPRTATDAARLAKYLYESRLFGDWPTPGSILATIMTGRSFGMDAVASLRGFHVVKGKAVPSSQLIIGLVKKHSEVEYLQMVESSAESATWEGKRKGEPKATKVTYTIEQAKRAGLLRSGSLWDKDPQTMLVWRAGVRLARILAPDVASGLYSAEEMDGVQ